MKPSQAYTRGVRTWVGRSVRVFVRDSRFRRVGPYVGIVKGLSDNAEVMENEGKDQYDATGLLVSIPELGREVTYGEWPVLFKDADCISTDLSE